VGHPRPPRYDALGRLLEVRTAQGAPEVSISYDGLGRPRVVTRPGGARTLRHSGAVLLEQQDGVAAPVTLFGAWGVDESLLAHGGGGWAHLLRDQTWSTLAATDDAGAVLWRAAWDPYGRGLALGPGFAAAAGGLPDLARFQGRPRLTDDLVDFRARVLSTELGRFAQVDPWHPFGDPNPYRFVGNNSLVGVDPEGELIWFVPILAGLIIGGAISAWANRDKSGWDFAVAVGAGAAGGAIAGSGLGTAGFIIGGAVAGGIQGAYDGGKKGGTRGALLGGTIGAVAGGVAGGVGGVVGQRFAGAVTTKVAGSIASGVLSRTAVTSLGQTGRYELATWVGTAAGGMVGGGAGGLTGGVIGGSGQVLANGGDFGDAVVTGGMSGLVGLRDGAMYGFVGGLGSRGLMWGGFALKTKAFTGILGNEGEWWMANQTLNRINNEVPNVGEPDAWGVPRLPGVKPVFGDAKNTQKLPNLKGTNNQFQRYLDNLPNAYDQQTNPTGNKLSIYHRPGISLPTAKHPLSPHITSGLVELVPLQQTVLLPPTQVPTMCSR